MFDDEFCASEDSVVINCDPCQYDDIQEEARAFCQDCNEYLCKQCLQSHRKFQAFRQHHILHADSMPTTREETKPKLTLKLCDNHRMTEVQYYCRNHECVFCSLCKVSKHSKCDCKLIDELISVSEDQAKFDNIVKKMEAIKTEFEQIRAVQIENIDSIASDSRVKRDFLSAVRKEMNLFLDRLENKIDEQEKKEKDCVKELKGSVQMCTEVVNHIASLKENIKDVSQSHDRVAIFSANCKLEGIAEEYATLRGNNPPIKMPEQSKNITEILMKVKETCKSMDDTDIEMSKQVPGDTDEHANSPANMFRKDEFNMDEVTQKEQNGPKESNNDSHWRNAGNNVHNHEGQVVSKHTADIKTEGSEKGPAVKIPEARNQDMSFYNIRQMSVSYHSINDGKNNSESDITGSLFLPDGSLILCDHGNSKVTLLDRNFNLQDELCFDGNVWDVALIDKNEIIVSLKHSKTLKFIKVSSGKLQERKRINLKMVPWGIAVYQQYIFITFHNNPGKGFIEVRDTSGRIIRAIDKSQAGEELFTSPFYVAVNQHNGDIYVTDSRENSLRCLSLNGELLYTMKSEKLHWPRKIILDDFGNCLICASLANKVVLVLNEERSTETSQYEQISMKVFLKDCKRPQTISVRKDDQTMVLGLNKSNTIQVVKLMFNNQQ